MYRISLLLITGFLLKSCLFGQSPPTLPRSATPPDISEKYRANPYFYEIMSAFPNSNSYYMYKFDEVKRNARHDPEAMVILGDHYRLGRSTPRDYKAALREYQRAAGKGYAKANHRIAYMYADGLGLPKEREKILEFMKKSADGGYDLAQYDCALIYLNGKFNEPRSVEKAYPYLVRAAAQGHKLSTELLAMLAFHASSPGTGIPTGLEEALKQFRKAGDTDGERALMQNISTYGGLRYYLRVIPGFLPGVDAALDPTDPVHGLRLLAQLKAQPAISESGHYEIYRAEITENILYHSYFKAQGNRKSLLDFIIFTQQHMEILQPGNNRYFDAAARDFRLTVNFSDEASLADYLAEFTTYPAMFAPEYLSIVADRVFVSIYLKETPGHLRKFIRDWLLQAEWPLHNLSPHYAVIFEQSELEGHWQDIAGMTHQGMEYINRFFRRVGQYAPESADSIAALVLPGLRNYCIHPQLTQLLLEHTGQARYSATVIQPMKAGIERAKKDIDSDINLYHNTLKTNPAVYGLDAADPEIRKMVDKVYQQILAEGAELLDRCCTYLNIQPAQALELMSQSRIASPWVLHADPTQRRSEEIVFEAWRRLLHISLVTVADPNGVIITPETSNVRVGSEPCGSSTGSFGQALQRGITPFAGASFTITNRSKEDANCRILLAPMERLTGESFNPRVHAGGYNRMASDWIVVPAGTTITIEMEINNEISWQLLLPCIEPEGSGFVLPYTKTISD
jgi:hypothetical protein